MECAFLVKTSLMLILKIQTMIQVIGGLQEDSAKDLACKILSVTETSQINPSLVAAILSVESNFISSKVSRTNDISIAQINVKVWKHEYPRVFKRRLDVTRLKTSDTYALSVMVDILTTLRERFYHKDPIWFARYHSSTKKYKQLYAKKVLKRLNFLENIKVLNEKNNVLAQVNR